MFPDICLFSKTFNLPTLAKADHTISFKMQNQTNDVKEEKLEEYNLDDNPTSRKEDVGLINRQKVTKRESQNDIKKDEKMDDVEMQIKSNVKPTNKDSDESPKIQKSVKFNEDEEVFCYTIYFFTKLFFYFFLLK